MHCSQAQDLLSTYYDDELDGDQAALVSHHAGKCSRCSDELASFARISETTSSLDEPVPPEGLWSQVQQQLDQQQLDQQVRGTDSVAPSSDRSRYASSLLPKLTAIAAAVIVAVGIGLLTHSSWSPLDEHQQFTADFGNYLDDFRRDPNFAQRRLVARYQGKRVDPSQAIHHVGYRPAVADGLPTGYSLEATHVMTMPCCTCVQTICRRSDGSLFAIFEHDDDETTQWFGGRPETTTTCHDKECCLVELDDQIAASWRRGTRHITLIGVRDIKEVSQMVAWLDATGQPVSN